jgi:hypothetical protein
MLFRNLTGRDAVGAVGTNGHGFPLAIGRVVPLAATDAGVKKN